MILNCIVAKYFETKKGELWVICSKLFICTYIPIPS